MARGGPGPSAESKYGRYKDNPIFHTLARMKGRCYNNKTKSWKHYEGKGITVHQEWLDNKDTFYEWAMANGWQKGLTIDRIDSNKNYEPSNCQWLTKAQNNSKVMRKRRGELAPFAKLSAAHVQVIKDLYKLNYEGYGIAKFIGVSYGTVYDILKGRTWVLKNEE